MSLHNADCIDVFKKIPDKSIDLILTDPPYLINYFSRRSKDKDWKFNKPIKGDKSRSLIENFFAESYRVLKDNTAMYCFCSPKSVDVFKQLAESSGFRIKNLICWIKNNWTAGDLQASFGCQYEFVMLLNKGRKVFNGKRLSDVWYFDRVNGKEQSHQNQKPVALIERCVLKHSNKGDIVLDPFMGSGTTGVAALKNDRKFIGVEIDKQYFSMAEERIYKEIER